MSKFLKEPIKIIQWQPTVDEKSAVEWKSKIYVCPGNVPADIKKAIISKNAKKLKKYYGDKWKYKLRIDDITKTKGGDGDPIIEIDLSSMDSLVEISDEKKEPPTVIVKDQSWEISDMEIFEEDTIMDLKKKINLAFNIPMYQQHLWVKKTQNSPLKYTFNIDGQDTFVDIIETYDKSKTFILGVPVDMNTYANKDLITVSANDEFDIIGQTVMKNNEINVISLNDIIEKNTKDKYKLNIVYYSFIIKFFPMLTKGTFISFLSDDNISQSVPSIAPNTTDLKFISKQNEVMHMLNQGDSKNFQQSLTKTVVKISSSIRGSIINFRILFDKLKCMVNIPLIAIHDIYENKHIFLSKQHVDYDGEVYDDEAIVPNSMVIKVRHEESYMDLFIFQNGTYSVAAKWNTDRNINFDDINHILDSEIVPIIRHINEKTEILYNPRHRLPMVSTNNIRYIGINLVVYWDRVMNNSDFSSVKAVLQKYFVDTQIVTEKVVADENYQEFYFKKGMFEFDSSRLENLSVDVANQYEYLTNSDIRSSWNVLFENIRIMKITHRYSDIKIEIDGIKEIEYGIFMKFVYLLEYLVDNSDIKIVNKFTRTIKHLQTLKEKDPVLYDMKKEHGSEMVYSKICQKPFQPIISNASDSNATKYWNFTTKSDIYYKCPNKKYPYLRFISGKHPLGYCIPCCKKTPPPPKKSTERSAIIYHTCLSEHSIDDSEIVESSSRYILGYGKTLDIGRITKLPEDTLGILLHSNISTNAQYYIMGTQQSLGNIENLGVLFLLSDMINMDISDMLKKAIIQLKKKPQRYCLILGGKLSLTMSVNAFISILLDIIRKKKITIELDINRIFIDIAQLYFKIKLFTFVDIKTVIRFQHNELVTHQQELVNPSYKYGVILYNAQTNFWNPIYKINKNLYFRAKIIDDKLYKYNSDIIQKIIGIVTYALESTIKDTSHFGFDFFTLDKFLQDSDYKLDSVFIVEKNFIYGVNIENVGYVPIKKSYVPFSINRFPTYHWKMKNNIELGDIKNVKLFIEKYTTWATGQNLVGSNRHFSLIELTKVIKYKTNIIGFIANDMNWYIKPIKKSPFSDVPVKEYIYSPLNINYLMESTKDLTISDAKIRPSIVKLHAYDMIKLHISNKINKLTNKSIRTKIISLIKKQQSSKLRIGMITQDHMQNVKYESDKHMRQDIIKINDHIHMANQDKKIAINNFEMDVYNFDKTYFHELKRQPLSVLKTKLMKMLKEKTPPIKDISKGSIKRFKISEIDKKTLKTLIDILASEIKNVFIGDNIFSPVFMSFLTNYFKFTKYPSEKISVKFG